MRVKKMALRLSALSLVAASFAAMINGGAANAVSAGDLVFTPTSDSTTDLTLEFDTTAPCPAGGATQILVQISGPGFDPVAPMVVVGLIPLTSLQPAGIPGGGKHLVAGGTLKALLQAEGVDPASGEYTFTATCQNASGSIVTGTFDEKFTYTRTAPYDGSWTTSAFAVSTTTTLAPVTSPTTYGDNVNLSATVAQGRGTVVPTGTVQFKDNGTNLGTPQTVTGGTATFSTSGLNAGSHSFTAVFAPADANAFAASTTAAAQSLTVNKKATGVSVSSNGPTGQYENAIFTATVTGGAAGSVQFTKDGVNYGSPVTVSAGTATKSDSTLPEGSYQIGAVFTPTDAANYNPSTATTAVTHNVTQALVKTAAQPIDVEVAAGELTIAIQGTVSGVVPTIHLGTAAVDPEGEWLTATGTLNNVIITDTRAGDPGWACNGSVSDFSNGAASFSGYNLGWNGLNVVSKSTNQVVTLGGNVIPAKVATGASYTGTDGLGTARPFASTPDNSGNGTAKIGGSLAITVPTDVPSGTYGATLTYTVL